jgi:hypothetical protein
MPFDVSKKEVWAMGFSIGILGRRTKRLSWIDRHTISWWKTKNS